MDRRRGAKERDQARRATEKYHLGVLFFAHALYKICIHHAVSVIVLFYKAIIDDDWWYNYFTLINSSEEIKIITILSVCWFDVYIPLFSSIRLDFSTSPCGNRNPILHILYVNRAFHCNAKLKTTFYFYLRLYRNRKIYRDKYKSVQKSHVTHKD